MKKKVLQDAITEENFNDLTKAIPYLLAGLEGLTNGNKLISVTLQQTDLSGFRVVLRSIQERASGDSVRVVGFTSGSSAPECLLFAEAGYRENVIRWHVDRFAKSVSQDGPSKNGRLVINDRD
jgi:hypothetical protein